VGEPHVVEENEWMNWGACVGMDPGIFFTARGESVEPAKEVCGRCDVQQECLNFALRRREKFGTWGGLTAQERRRIRRRERRGAA
jgi:WhiB family redox-sensing transcriptional regulator